MHQKLRAISGPLVIAMWQLAPVTATQDSVGRVRVSFGYGRGSLQRTALSCAGEVVGVDKYEYQTGGVRADAWPVDHLRLTGFGGRRVITDHAVLLGSPPGDYGGPVDYYGFQLAYEGRRFGIGAGRQFETSSAEDLNAYIRVGNIDGIHVRTDYNAPGALHGTTGRLRIGLEKNSGHIRAPGWSVGMAFCHFCADDGDYSAYGEAVWPAFNSVDLVGQGLIGSAERGSIWSFGMGARVSF